jgi:hypothetical protein
MFYALETHVILLDWFIRISYEYVLKKNKLQISAYIIYKCMYFKFHILAACDFHPAESTYGQASLAHFVKESKDRL